MVPGIVIGFGLLNYFAYVGLNATFARLLIVHVIITFPFTFRTIGASLMGFDQTLEEASLSLGADAITTFRRITFPIVKPGIVVGALFAFAISLGDIDMTIFLVDPYNTTLPVALYSALRSTVNPSLAAASLVLMGFSALLLLVVEMTIGLERFTGITGTIRQ
jgi:putative spermidine/putrescine transport system permease protein